LNKIRIVKSIIIFMLILAVIIVPVIMNQAEKSEVVSPSSKEFVFKEIKPNEEMEEKQIENNAELEEQIKIVLKDAKLQGATTAISIRNAVDGKILYTNLGDTRVHPASLMKLFTGVAALETLGIEHTFKTELYTDGKIKDGKLQGNLYIKGLGDPTELSPE
jgi:serine-type D-Ala-D-Ala carboxypeptidase/endopeptidase (penicillin-binding protein 4)